jgi:hypothetical protein
LRPIEPEAESIEAGDQLECGPRAVRRLLDRGTGRVPGRYGRRRGAGAILLVVVRRQHARRTLFAPGFSSRCNETYQRARFVMPYRLPDDDRLVWLDARRPDKNQEQKAHRANHDDPVDSGHKNTFNTEITEVPSLND